MEGLASLEVQLMPKSAVSAPAAVEELAGQVPVAVAVVVARAGKTVARWDREIAGVADVAVVGVVVAVVAVFAAADVAEDAAS